MLKDYLKIKLQNDSYPCKICHLAKQCCETFPLRDHETSDLGELVHLDVWGPYKVNSKEGYKSFLTVVDDFARVIWVYLLKLKVKFIELVEFFLTWLNINLVKPLKLFGVIMELDLVMLKCKLLLIMME